MACVVCQSRKSLDREVFYRLGFLFLDPHDGVHRVVRCGSRYLSLLWLRDTRLRTPQASMSTLKKWNTLLLGALLRCRVC